MLSGTQTCSFRLAWPSVVCGFCHCSFKCTSESWDLPIIRVPTRQSIHMCEGWLAKLPHPPEYWYIPALEHFCRGPGFLKGVTHFRLPSYFLPSSMPAFLPSFLFFSSLPLSLPSFLPSFPLLILLESPVCVRQCPRHLGTLADFSASSTEQDAKYGCHWMSH